MKPYAFPVLEKDKIRVIITTDAKNEADDQFAIAYALMSPKLEVCGIVAAHFCKACSMPASAHYSQDPADADLTMDKSYEEILRVLSKMGLEGRYPVLRGAKRELPDAQTPQDSEGARFIIEEAHRPGKPLYVVNLGAITDLASAYLIDPSIADGIAGAFWLGGGMFPEGGPEFNLENDIAAGNVLMDSRLQVSLLPLNATAPMKMAYSELFYRVRPYGEIGRYLCDQMLEHASRCTWNHGESWILWDIAAVALLLDQHPNQFVVRNAPRFAPDMRYVEVDRPHPIRVYERIEPRFAFEDFYCKLALHFDRNPN